MSNDVIQAVGVFFSYAVLAIFAQNAVFTRGLGVSRLVQLVGDERTSWTRRDTPRPRVNTAFCAKTASTA